MSNSNGTQLNFLIVLYIYLLIIRQKGKNYKVKEENKSVSTYNYINMCLIMFHLRKNEIIENIPYILCSSLLGRLKMQMTFRYCRLPIGRIF